MKVKLGDILHIKHGYAFKGEYFTDENTGKLVLTPGNFSLQGGFLPTKKFTKEENFPQEFVLKPGDLIVTMTDLSKEIDTIGYSALVPNDNLLYLHNQRIGLVTINDDNYDYAFIYWLMRSKHYQRSIANTSNGATVHHTSPDRIYKYQFDRISLAKQRRIASILSAYDNLIENNNKRIRLLEQMAENLYKEWFVRFRFPGHEKAEFENGLPKGWKIDKFGKYADVKRGGSPRPIQDYLSEEGLNWLKISDVTSLSSPYVFQINEKIKKEGLKKTVYRKAGTLVLSNSATPGISKILCVDTCIHDGWLYFENSYFSNEFLNLFFQHERANILKFGNGAVFTNLKTDILKNYNMSIPPLKILDDFQEIIMPIYELLKVIVQKNQILTRERDLLLPRLMSGKLEVNI